jgi:hypothetical protein
MCVSETDVVYMYTCSMLPVAAAQLPLARIPASCRHNQQRTEAVESREGWRIAFVHLLTAAAHLPSASTVAGHSVLGGASKGAQTWTELKLCKLCVTRTGCHAALARQNKS